MLSSVFAPCICNLNLTIATETLGFEIIDDVAAEVLLTNFLKFETLET